MAEWFETGLDSSMEGDPKGMGFKGIRYWMPRGEERMLVFLSNEPLFFGSIILSLMVIFVTGFPVWNHSASLVLYVIMVLIGIVLQHLRLLTRSSLRQRMGLSDPMSRSC
jgi:hypothetical protein